MLQIVGLCPFSSFEFYVLDTFTAINQALIMWRGERSVRPALVQHVQNIIFRFFIDLRTGLQRKTENATVLWQDDYCTPWEIRPFNLSLQFSGRVYLKSFAVYAVILQPRLVVNLAALILCVKRTGKQQLNFCSLLCCCMRSHTGSWQWTWGSRRRRWWNTSLQVDRSETRPKLDGEARVTNHADAADSEERSGFYVRSTNPLGRKHEFSLHHINWIVLQRLVRI